MVPKMKSYSKTVQALNNARLKGDAFGAICSFMDVFRQLGEKSDGVEHQIENCWLLLSYMLNERNVVKGKFQRGGDALKQMHYSQMYKAQDEGVGLADDAVAFRKMVIAGGKEFLHAHFWKFIDSTVHQHHAVVGGMPSVDQIVDAFIHIKFKKYGQWSRAYLEVYENDQAIWAHLFYLIRAGHLTEACEYVNAHDRNFARTDANFVGYFKAWVSSGNGRLPKRLRETLLLFWNNQIRPLIALDQKGQWVGGDPFRVALYKILGRCEMSRKHMPGSDAILSAEDYLWFQLMLVQEDIRSDEPVQERFSLRDMAKLMMKFGAAHFSPKGRQPILWATVLLLCGEFERAIQFLFCDDNYMVDAVHFAIALAYYGVLRIPDSPHVGDAGIPLLNFRTITSPGGNYDLTYLNFARMIHQYTRLFSVNNPIDALHYVYVVGLFGRELDDGADHVLGNRLAAASNNSYNSVSADVSFAREYTRLVHAHVREVILENVDHLVELLGQVRMDGVRMQGDIEKYRTLLHIISTQEFVTRIIKTSAEQCDRDGRYEYAIKLFDLAGEYDIVVGILNKRLGEALSEQRYASTGGSGDGGLGISSFLSSSPSKNRQQSSSSSSPVAETLKLAEQILDSYMQRQHTSSKIKSERQKGCSVLIALHRFMNCCESNDLFTAVEIMDSLKLFPNRFEDAGNINRMAVELQNLDEHVGRALPVVLISLMTVLSKIFFMLKEGRYAGGGVGVGKGDGLKQAQLEDLQSRAKSLVVFSANVRYKIPGDVYGQLIKIEADLI